MQTALGNPLVLALIIMGIVVVVLIGVVVWMHMRIKRFLVGSDSDNLSDSLSYVRENLEQLHNFRKEIDAYLKTVEKRLRRSIQSVHTVRFNPYKGTGEGGNQSFATSFLNEEGNGVVISSLHSRDHVRVFSKPIMKHVSDYELSDEEREAIETAKEIIIIDTK